MPRWPGATVGGCVAGGAMVTVASSETITVLVSPTICSFQSSKFSVFSETVRVAMECSTVRICAPSMALIFSHSACSARSKARSAVAASLVAKTIFKLDTSGLPLPGNTFCLVPPHGCGFVDSA